MSLPDVPPPATQEAIDNYNRCQSDIDMWNDFAISDARRFKASQPVFWQSDLSVENMQLKIDTFAQTDATDPIDNTVKTVLDAFFAKAKREIIDVLTETPDAFDESLFVYDDAGEKIKQPDGTPYQQWLTPAWFYEVDVTKPSKMKVIGPITWMQPPT